LELAERKVKATMGKTRDLEDALAQCQKALLTESVARMSDQEQHTAELARAEQTLKSLMDELNNLKMQSQMDAAERSDMRIDIKNKQAKVKEMAIHGFITGTDKGKMAIAVRQWTTNRTDNVRKDEIKLAALRSFVFANKRLINDTMQKKIRIWRASTDHSMAIGKEEEAVTNLKLKAQSEIDAGRMVLASLANKSQQSAMGWIVATLKGEVTAVIRKLLSYWLKRVVLEKQEVEAKAKIESLKGKQQHTGIKMLDKALKTKLHGLRGRCLANWKVGYKTTKNTMETSAELKRSQRETEVLRSRLVEERIGGVESGDGHRLKDMLIDSQEKVDKLR